MYSLMKNLEYKKSIKLTIKKLFLNSFKNYIQITPNLIKNNLDILESNIHFLELYTEIYIFYGFQYLIFHLKCNYSNKL